MKARVALLVELQEAADALGKQAVGLFSSQEDDLPRRACWEKASGHWPPKGKGSCDIQCQLGFASGARGDYKAKGARQQAGQDKIKRRQERGKRPGQVKRL
jgi:hypothetical protein